MRVYRCNIATIAIQEHKRNPAQKRLHIVAISVQNIDLTVSNGIPIYVIKIVIWLPNGYTKSFRIATLNQKWLPNGYLFM